MRRNGGVSLAGTCRGSKPEPSLAIISSTIFCCVRNNRQDQLQFSRAAPCGVRDHVEKLGIDIETAQVDISVSFCPL